MPFAMKIIVHLKVFNVCINYFRDEDVELLHKLPNGDGTFTEMSLGKLKLKDDTIPCPLIIVHHIILQHGQSTELFVL